MSDSNASLSSGDSFTQCKQGSLEGKKIRRISDIEHFHYAWYKISMAVLVDEMTPLLILRNTFYNGSKLIN